MALLVSVAGLLTVAVGLLGVRNFPQAVQGGEYKSSYQFSDKMAGIYYNLHRVAFEFKSEANIRAGACLATDDQYQSDVTQLKQDSQNTIDGLQAEAQPSPTPDEAGNTPEGSGKLTESQKTALQQKIQQEKDALNTRIAKAREEAVARELGEFQIAQDSLKGETGLYYRASLADGTVYTNMPLGQDADGFFGGLPASIELRQGEYNATLSRSYRSFQPVPAGGIVYLGIDADRYLSLEKVYRSESNAGTVSILETGAGVLVFLAGLCWLMLAAGRRPGVEGVQLIFLDWLYLDIVLVLTLAVVGGSAGGLALLYAALLSSTSVNTVLIYSAGAALTVIITLVSALFLTSAAKRLKRGEFLRHTLFYTVFAWLGRGLRIIFGQGPLALRWAILFVAYAFASFLLIVAFGMSIRGGIVFPALFCLLLFAVMSLIGLLFVLHKASAIRAILTGTQKIRAGGLSHRIPVTGGGELAELARNINSIAEGMGAALEHQLKAERMRTELITNVSHDLRTPLTSIITYIDLLKAEGPGGASAGQYIAVLDAKAQRLRELTDDLFEAAKAASGSIKPTMARLDVRELLSQGMGELEDRIGDSGLDVRVSLPEEPLMVMADGKLLWRVMENLFSNVFKYAQTASRVYVSAIKTRGRVVITVKNVSACELNLPASELMERFTRGDSARHSEGSGLGLSIAKSLVELQGGRFAVEIDGDLFKTYVDLPELK